jgi:hypothetical protein
MQNLINKIIKQEKHCWDMYLFSLKQFGAESEPATRWRSYWHTYSDMIKEFNLTAPTKRRNLSTFKHKKYNTVKTCEL